MEWFYFIVIAIAIIILILLLAYIGISMGTNSTGISTQFPPIKNSCPDLWKADPDADNTCIIPVNNDNTEYDTTRNVGTAIMGDATKDFSHADTKTHGFIPYTSTEAAAINFNDAGWAGEGKTTDCAKKEWANTNQISWDGISNFNQCN
jgi:hypothetical protein